MKIPNIDIKRILYATDESESARYAFAYATGLAQKLNAQVTMLHVVQELKDMVAFDFGIERSVAAKKWFSLSQEYYQEIKSKFESLAAEEYYSDSIDDVIVEKGNPVKMILNVAQDRNCDLIVMGSKGRESLEDSMMGNTVIGVLRRSQIPVLVISHGKAKKL